MALYGAVSVFVSSTCYDLVDLRPELGQMLAANGFVVLVSEDVSSAIYVDSTDYSIASCLKNVEASNVLVCIDDLGMFALGGSAAQLGGRMKCLTWDYCRSLR